MKPAILFAVVLAIPLTVAFAWKQTGTAAGTVKTASMQLYNGVSVNGVLQEAINDALTKAQAAMGKTTADVQFTWTLSTVSGKRGGIAGSQELDVQIQVPVTVGGTAR